MAIVERIKAFHYYHLSTIWRVRDTNGPCLAEVVDVLQRLERPVGTLVGKASTITFRLFIGKKFFTGMRMPYLDDPVSSVSIAQGPRPKRPLN